jgi:hypothetical protein
LNNCATKILTIFTKNGEFLLSKNIFGFFCVVVAGIQSILRDGDVALGFPAVLYWVDQFFGLNY